MTISNSKNEKNLTCPQNKIQWADQAILAIDYGEKFTGLAKFHLQRDPFPYPYGRIQFKDLTSFLNNLEKIVGEEEINVLVLGIPTLLDGKETSMTQKIKNFGKVLEEYFPKIPLYYQDETLSTFEAQERMKRSPRYNFKVSLQEIDALSASIILEDFLRLHKLYQG